MVVRILRDSMSLCAVHLHAPKRRTMAIKVRCEGRRMTWCWNAPVMSVNTAGEIICCTKSEIRRIFQTLELPVARCTFNRTGYGRVMGHGSHRVLCTVYDVPVPSCQGCLLFRVRIRGLPYRQELILVIPIHVRWGTGTEAPK